MWVSERLHLPRPLSDLPPPSQRAAPVTLLRTQSITLLTRTEGPCRPSTDLPLLILTCVGRLSSGPFWSVPNSHQPPQTLAKLCFYSFPVQNEAVPSVDFIYRGCQDSRKAGLERNKMWWITYSLPVLFYTLSKSIHKMKPDIFSCY